MKGFDLQHYDKMLGYAYTLIRNKPCLLDKYDIVHAAFAEFGEINPRNIRNIYQSNLYLKAGLCGSNKNLATPKICKRCSPGDPLPPSAFIVITDNRYKLTYLSSFCRRCMGELKEEWRLKNNHTDSFKAKSIIKSKRYYDANKKSKQFLAKKQRQSNESRQRNNAKQPALWHEIITLIETITLLKITVTNIDLTAYFDEELIKYMTPKNTLRPRDC